MMQGTRRAPGEGRLSISGSQVAGALFWGAAQSLSCLILFPNAGVLARGFIVACHKNSPKKIMTVLVLDDDDNYRELVLLTLQEQCGAGEVLGFDAASPLLEHVAQPGQREPDLLLLDLHLADGTGLEVLHRLRALGVQAPAAFRTGAGDSTEQQACLAAGAVAVLVKPLDYGELVRKLQALTKALHLSSGVGA